jgi:hypothetical protein
MTVGEQMSHLRRALPERRLGPHYATADDVLPDLVGILRGGDRLLVKASNGTRLHEVVTHMRRQLGSVSRAVPEPPSAAEPTGPQAYCPSSKS